MPDDQGSLIPAIEEAVPVVVGVHWQAEVLDRPVAHWLCTQVRQWVEANQARLSGPMVPVVCTDVWFINHRPLHRRPVICVGHPEVNSLSAVLMRRGKQDTSTDELVIQLDKDMVDLQVGIWAAQPAWLMKAAELFAQHYLDEFLTAAATQVIPDDGEVA